MSHQRGGANGLSKPLSSFSRALVFPEPFTICICYFSYVHLHSNLTLLWLPLAPFCPPLGSVWPPLAPLWLPFGSHGAPFWLPSALLGTKPLHYTTARDTAGLWPMNLLIYKALFFLFTRLFVSTCHRLMPAFDHTAAIQSLGAVVAGDASSTSAMALRYCCR